MSVIRPINNLTTTVAASGTVTADLVTTGFNEITLIARLGNATTPATAAADISMTVQPYDDAGNIVPISLPVDFTSPANTLAASIANALADYQLDGV